MTIFGDRNLKEVTGLNEVIRVGPYTERTGVLTRRGRETREAHK